MVISCVLIGCCYGYELVIDLFALQVEMEGGVMKHMLRVREQVSPKHSSKAGLDEDLLSMVHELSQVRTCARLTHHVFFCKFGSYYNLKCMIVTVHVGCCKHAL